MKGSTMNAFIEQFNAQVAGRMHDDPNERTGTVLTGKATARDEAARLHRMLDIWEDSFKGSRGAAKIREMWAVQNAMRVQNRFGSIQNGAPTPSSRTIPTGYKLPDGFKTTVVCSNNTAVQFWEETVGLPPLDGGERIKTSTMLNTKWHTFAFRTLIDVGETETEAGWDPDVYTYIIADLNFPMTITYHLPDNSTFCHFGGFRKFAPRPMKEGEFPMATITFVSTNYDYIGAVEAGPAFASAAGT
jgi:hypothetical protein